MNKITTEKVIKTTGEAEQIMRRAKRRAKRLFGWKVISLTIILVAFLCAGVVFYGFMQISAWYDVNKVSFQNPLILRFPVVVSLRNVSTVRKSTRVASTVIVEPFLPIVNEAYRKVRVLESNAGMSRKDLLDLHNYCQSIGKVNEIGWRPFGSVKRFCFDSYAEEYAQFKKTFIERLEVMTLDEALCIHNTGKKQPMCKYSVEFHNL